MNILLWILRLITFSGLLIVAKEAIRTMRSEDDDYELPCYRPPGAFPTPAKLFSVSQYFDHIERVMLQLREEAKADYTIILWWGFDGLRLNKDGNTEWISRRKNTVADINVQSPVTININCVVNDVTPGRDIEGRIRWDTIDDVLYDITGKPYYVGDTSYDINNIPYGEETQ